MGGKLIPIIFVALTSKVFCQDLAFPKAEEEGNQPISLKNYCLQCWDCFLTLIVIVFYECIPHNILSVELAVHLSKYVPSIEL